MASLLDSWNALMISCDLSASIASYLEVILLIEVILGIQIASFKMTYRMSRRVNELLSREIQITAHPVLCVLPIQMSFAVHYTRY